MKYKNRPLNLNAKKGGKWAIWGLLDFTCNFFVCEPRKIEFLVPVKPVSDQGWIRHSYFSNWKAELDKYLLYIIVYDFEKLLFQNVVSLKKWIAHIYTAGKHKKMYKN